MSWQPTSSIQHIKARADLLKNIRAFFAKHGVMEVSTPLLSQYGVTDVHMECFSTQYHNGSHQQTYYLQTSPEYAMKRLLAAGSGAIYQICKAFRNGECGPQHNPEFTMLEWYRPDYNHHGLVAEIDLFLQKILNTNKAEKISYQQLFEKHFSINPHTVNHETLSQRLNQHQVMVSGNIDDLDKDSLLQLLMTHILEPKLGINAPLFIYDFPASQAALSRIRHDNNVPIAERFELYINGKEIANGFHELTHAEEQQQRFIKDQQAREARGLEKMAIDKNLIAALEAGMPNCAGVAIGLDRLLMHSTSTTHIDDVICFPWQRA